MFKKNIFTKMKDSLEADNKIIKETNQKIKSSTPPVLNFSPANQDDVLKVADAILGNNIVYVSFNKLSENDKRNFKSFINGIVYASGAHMQKIQNDQYIFSSKENT